MQTPFPPAPAAATAHATQYPASTEPFGAVNASYTSPAQRRRQSPYLLSPTTYSGAQIAMPPRHEENTLYGHNVLVAVFLVPPLICILWNHVSPMPLQAFLYIALIVYAADLANLRDFYVTLLWIGAFVITLVNAGAALVGVSGEVAGGANRMLMSMKLVSDCLLFVCLVSQSRRLRSLNDFHDFIFLTFQPVFFSQQTTGLLGDTSSTMVV